MKKFEFNLERVLRLKQQRERLAEIRQQQARLVFEAAQAEVRRLREQLDRSATQMGSPTDSFSLLARQAHAMTICQQLEAAMVREATANQRLQEATAARAKIATEVEALLHLRSQQWQAHRQQMARAHQELLDEVGLRRWMKAQAERERQAEPRSGP